MYFSIINIIAQQFYLTISTKLHFESLTFKHKASAFMDLVANYARYGAFMNSQARYECCYEHCCVLIYK